MWYAEYTDNEVIRRFPNVYRSILDVLDRHPDVKVGWDIEASRSIAFLKEVAPDVTTRIRRGVAEGRFEIILGTWSFSLPSLHTLKEFVYQHRLAVNELEETFGRISNGYFGQEDAYHPAMPKILRDLGISFIILFYGQVLGFEPSLHPSNRRLHLLVGHDGTEIPCVLFSTWENVVDAVEALEKSQFKDCIYVWLSDAEMVVPDQLEAWISELEKKEYVKFSLVSEYVSTNEHGMVLRNVQDSTWARDYYLWIRDPFDQHLWTLNEQARNAIYRAEYWVKRAEQKGINVLNEKRRIEEAKAFLLLGQNSDKMGWNPCPYRRVQGEYEFKLAFENAAIAEILASEKVFHKEFPVNKDELGLKSYLLFNHHNFRLQNMPMRLPFAFSPGVVKLEELQTYVNDESTLLDVIDAKVGPDGSLLEGNFVSIVTLDPGQITNVRICQGEKFKVRSTLVAKPNLLENDLIRLELENGVPVSLEDKEGGHKYSSPSGYLLTFSTKLEGDEPLERRGEVKVTNPGARGVYAEILVEEAKTKNCHCKSFYRVYRGVKAVEIERRFYITRKHVGEVKPYILDVGLGRPRKLWRELSDHVTFREILANKSDVAALVNEWCAVSNRGRGIMVSVDGKTRSSKEIVDLPTGEFLILYSATTHPENPFEAFSGFNHYKLALIPFEGEAPPGAIINWAKGYNNSPGVIPIIHFEGPRTL